MLNGAEVKCFEADLNNFEREVRDNALAELRELCDTRKVRLHEPQDDHNLHCHTFYSYNGYGFSPSYIAWLAKKSGWFAAGIVDFDVLDGVDEFLNAAAMLNIRGVCGMETRVFIDELAGDEINSPGEPGISYHMGVGFTSSNISEKAAAFQQQIKNKAAARTRGIVDLVNACLAPVVIDFEQGAAVLTPNGNVTERHACAAYRAKGEEVFPAEKERAGFWSSKLGISTDDATKLLNDPVALEGLIRGKTMKRGGVGYVQPDPSAFPTLAEMNSFCAACGAIPTITWLNGESVGESDPGKLLDLHIAQGGAFLNIIPDRNWNFSDPEIKTRKVAELNRIIAAAAKRHMPVIIGTEMNAPGQKLVDDFTADALAPHVECFVNGAAIAFAHTLLTQLNMGYLSEWAQRELPELPDRNRFFAVLGNRMTPQQFNELDSIIPEKLEEALRQL